MHVLPPMTGWTNRWMVGRMKCQRMSLCPIIFSQPSWHKFSTLVPFCVWWWFCMWFKLEKDLDASDWNERFSCYFPWFANEKRQTMEIGCSHGPNGLSHKCTIDRWMDGHLGMSTYAPYQMDIQRFFLSLPWVHTCRLTEWFSIK